MACLLFSAFIKSQAPSMDITVVNIISFRAWEVPDQPRKRFRFPWEDPDEPVNERIKIADIPNPRASELSSELQHVRNTEFPLEYSIQLLADRPKDPTVWEIRRSVVGKIDLEKELDFVGKLAERDSRNHLIWHYRRWIVEKVGSEAASKELESTKKILSKDAKIYQAWSHREWIVKKFGGSWLMAELQYCQEILEKDSYNIFAWDQRCRIVRSIPNMEKEFKDKEASYAKKAIEAQPGNESPWTYLKCLYIKDQTALYKESDLESIYVNVLAKEADRVEAAVELEEIDPPHNVVDVIVDKRGCLHAINLILDLIFLGYQGSEKLSKAVDVLLDNRADSFPRMRPWMIPAKSEIFRKLFTLVFSLDAERICFCNKYCGFPQFEYYHLGYLESLQRNVVNMEF